MKKRDITNVIVMLAVIAMLAGCGAKKTPEAQTNATGETQQNQTVEDSVTENPVTDSDETQTPDTEIADADDSDDTNNISQGVSAEPEAIIGHDTLIKGNRADEASKDNMSFYVCSDVEIPYYVGKEDASFLADKQYDRVIYLNNPAYLAAEGNYWNRVTRFEVSDPEIAEVTSDGVFIPKKQGIVTLSAYKNGELLSEEVVAVTTFNDGRDDIASCKSFDDNNYYFYSDVNNPEMWRMQINTIQDMCIYLQERNWQYDFVEPEATQTEFGDWQWMPEGSKIATYNNGVCVEVAQVAVYMLAGDYEDWGCITTYGKYGHIFNWFYEDGYYYLMDFTEVISDNRYNSYQVDQPTRDYTHAVKRFSTIEAITEWVNSIKVDTRANHATVMYSCLGHDCIPVSRDTGCHDPEDIKNGTMDGERVKIQYENIVFESGDFYVLWKDPRYDFEISGVPTEEISPIVRAQAVNAVYGQKIRYFHTY